MRESEKKNTPTSNTVKRSMRTQRRNSKLLERSGSKVHSLKETESKVLHGKSAPNDVHENGIVESRDGYKSEDSLRGKKEPVCEDTASALEGPVAEQRRENLKVKEVHSDSVITLDSVSSQGYCVIADEERPEGPFQIHQMKNIGSNELSASVSSVRSAEKPMEPCIDGVPTKDSSDNGSSELCEDKPAEDPEGEAYSEALNGVDDGASDSEPSDPEPNGLLHHRTSSKLKDSNGVISNENGTESVKTVEFPDRSSFNQKIEEMEARIEKLEEELREVAALEISLYTIVPEHGSSAHKLHSPARRLSCLYIHACKQWTQSRRATIARNSVSGLVLVARSCGNDVSRLTFWLSNTVVLREIIAQAFGGGKVITVGNHSSAEVQGSLTSNKMNKKGVTRLIEDWQETGTFISALEKVESWIFSRIVELVWWQALTPQMQSSRGLLGSALGDQKQGSFSIDLWRDAFMDAFHRLCPVQAGGRECGCLPVLTRMVIAQCVARLDVAMFNAILRESEQEVPADPVSDPIVDATVLPIPAGDLSFVSGAQLKIAVGNWSRYLHELFGMDVGYPSYSRHDRSEDTDQENAHAGPEYFNLLNELSDLLMLPKDMLADQSIRKEVCPSISLPLVKRIVCNFTPDEFCPDDVPGEVLEVLNAESILEQGLSGDSTGNFTYPAAPVVYSPPSTEDIAEKVAEAGGKARLKHNAYTIQSKGYTSDEELENLDSPLACVAENSRSSTDPPQLLSVGERLEQREQFGYAGVNIRYKLLREVWSV